MNIYRYVWTTKRDKIREKMEKWFKFIQSTTCSFSANKKKEKKALLWLFNIEKKIQIVGIIHSLFKWVDPIGRWSWRSLANRRLSISRIIYLQQEPTIGKKKCENKHNGKLTKEEKII